MHLIEEEEVFRQKVSEIDLMIDRRMEFPKQVFREQFSRFRVIDFDEIYSEPFFQTMNKFVRDKILKWTFFVLSNDPENFFFSHCKKYPFFEVSCKDLFEDYLSITRDNLQCIPQESLADNAYIIVLYPDSLDWVIYGDFDFEIAIVGFKETEVIENFAYLYTENRIFTMEEAIPNLLETIYKDHIVPEDIRTELLANYS